MKIECIEIEKIIQGTCVLHSINLSLEGGRTYGLWGKNGCGKTMLMRVMSGLILPSSGKVLIDGKELGKELSFPPSMGILIENPAFLNGYTGFQNLKIIASIRGTASDDDIRNSLERVGLDPEDRRKYYKYSLGMKQRLGIACALFEKPDILILDEPINALDEKGVDQIRTVLSEEKERGALIIVACHDREEMDLLADEIIYMQEGRIVEKNV